MKILAVKTDCNGVIYGMLRMGLKQNGYHYGIEALTQVPKKVRDRSTEISGKSSSIRQRFKAIK